MSNTEKDIKIDEKDSTIEKESTNIDNKEQQVADDFVSSGGSDIQNITTYETQLETLDVDTNFHHDVESTEDKDLDTERGYFDNTVQSGNECGGTSVAAPEPIIDIDPEPVVGVPDRGDIISVDTINMVDAIIALEPQDIDFNIVDAPVTEPVAITPPAIIESPIDLTDPFIDSIPETIIDPFAGDSVIAIDNSGYIDAVAIYSDLPDIADVLVIEQDSLLVDAIEPAPSTHIEIERAVIIEPEPLPEIGAGLPVGIADVPSHDEFFVDMN